MTGTDSIAIVAPPASLRKSSGNDSIEHQQAQPPVKSSRQRTVLIIASRFPPVAAVGATRIRKFVKYLGEFGWNSVIITGAAPKCGSDLDDAQQKIDLETLAEIPTSVPVHRIAARWDDWPAALSGAMADRICRWSPFSLIRDSLGRRFEWRMRRIHDYCVFPDRQIWRLPAAVRLAIELHRKHRFDAIFSSGMPFSDHMIGLTLQRLLRRPWLADFRDPWAEYIHWPQWKTEIGRRMSYAAESAVVRRAGRVISVNEQMTERFRERYRGHCKTKFITIENGFDTADFEPRTNAKDESQFRLLYAGSLYRTRTPDVMLEAFGRFIRQTPGSASRVQFTFAGRPGPYLENLRNSPLGDNIEYVGMLPHRQTMRAMAQTDVNVVLLPDIPGGANDITAKIYECLGSGRAILAVVPKDGAAARLLSAHEGVWQCDPSKAEDISRALTDLYGRWLSGSLPTARSETALRSCTRRHQTRLLASALDDVVGANKEVAR